MLHSLRSLPHSRGRAIRAVAFPPVAVSSLQIPPLLAPNAMRVVALGGLGDVGRNMAAIEFDGQLLLIDCGVQPGPAGRLEPAPDAILAAT